MIFQWNLHAAWDNFFCPDLSRLFQRIVVNDGQWYPQGREISDLIFLYIPTKCSPLFVFGGVGSNLVCWICVFRHMDVDMGVPLQNHKHDKFVISGQNSMINQWTAYGCMVCGEIRPQHGSPAAVQRLNSFHDVAPSKSTVCSIGSRRSQLCT